MRKTVLSALALSALVVLGACTGDDDDSGAASTLDANNASAQPATTVDANASSQPVATGNNASQQPTGSTGSTAPTTAAGPTTTVIFSAPETAQWMAKLKAIGAEVSRSASRDVYESFSTDALTETWVLVEPSAEKLDATLAGPVEQAVAAVVDAVAAKDRTAVLAAVDGLNAAADAFTAAHPQ